MILATPSWAQGLSAPAKAVTYDTSRTLRDLVADGLADPDLWPLVLKLNGIASLDDLKPGTVLLLPVEQVAIVDRALQQALDAIQKATSEGARLFAPAEIGAAIENRDGAVVDRGRGAWQASLDLSATATDLAGEALKISLAQRDRSAEALLTDIHGAVEGRAPAQSAWTGRELNAVLIENERVRTLSASTAQITFRDLSRLRLNPNSNATIQTMRSDPLTGGEVTKVNLVTGDFYALLNRLSDRTTFDIEVEGVKTTTESADFWISKEGEGARFANYDSAALEIEAGGKAISIGRNEGAVVDSDGSTQVTNVLPRLELATPLDAGTLYGAAADLSWAAAPDAAGYWLEVASDPAFNHMRVSEWGIAPTAFRTPDLEPGRYHWRVAALDAFGLPGEWSLARSFDLVADDTPPFLVLARPANAALVETETVTMEGETEPGATLLADGKPVPLSPDGRFEVDRAAQPGENRIVLTAIDPAGNRTERSVVFTYRPASTVGLAVDAGLPRDEDGVLLTRTDDLAVRATADADPGAPVRLVDAAGRQIALAVVEAGGLVSVTAPATDETASFVLQVLSPTGSVEGSVDIALRRDAEPPVLRFDPPPPPSTTAEQVSIAGTAEGAVDLTLDGEAVPLSAGGFSVERPLAAGRNTFELVARDRVGNVLVRTLSVIRDTTPPTVERAAVSRPDGADGIVEIVAAASDDFGLRPAGAFLVAVDGVRERGVMRCDGTARQCRATLPARAGRVELIEVVVEDYAGNRGRFPQ